jgi:hypothetical protein
MVSQPVALGKASVSGEIVTYPTGSRFRNKKAAIDADAGLSLGTFHGDLVVFIAHPQE